MATQNVKDDVPKMNASHLAALNKGIDNIERQANGNALRSSLVSLFTNISSGAIKFVASTLGGKRISEYVTKEAMKEIMESGENFDPQPILDSKKAVQSAGILEFFGDFRKTYNNYTSIVNEYKGIGGSWSWL